MKTKLYTLLTGLLMAACVTSYGQTFTCHLALELDKTLNGCDIVENTDNTLLVGTRVLSEPNQDESYLICKITPNCELLDSLSFSEKSSTLLINRNEPDHYMLPEFQEDEVENAVFLKLTQIDNNLNVVEETLIPIANLSEGVFKSGRVFIDSHNNVVASFWLDTTLHFISVTIDGTINASKEISDVFIPNFSYQHPADTALCYSNFGVYSETPLQYYLIGGYINDDASPHLWPFYNYIFDEDFNLVETVLFEHDRFGNQYDWTGYEQIVSLDENTYLLSSINQDPYYNIYWTGIDFFNRNHYLKYGIGANANFGHPIQIAVADSDRIYYSFVNHNPYHKDSKDANKVKVERLDTQAESLSVWSINMPAINLEDLRFGDGQRMIVLENDDVAICFTAIRNEKNYMFVYIIRDEYEGTDKNITDESHFSLYPNPVKDQLTLSFAEGNAPESVELYDLQGRLVGMKRNNMETIDMSAMPSGVYMLRVTLKDGMNYHEKIVKE